MTASDLGQIKKKKHFYQSSTVQGAMRVGDAYKGKDLATAATLAASLAPILLTEIGVKGFGADLLTHALNGVISGQSAEAIATGGLLAVAGHFLSKKHDKELKEQLIQGRLKANESEINPESIPLEYRRIGE